MPKIKWMVLVLCHGMVSNTSANLWAQNFSASNRELQFSDSAHLKRYDLIRSLNQNTVNSALRRALANHATTEEKPLLKRKAFVAKRRIRALLLSPDGSRLAYLLREKKGDSLWIMEVASQKTTLLFTAKIKTLLQWSSDSQFVFFQVAKAIAYADIHSKQPSYFTALDQQQETHFRRVDPSHPHHVIVGRILHQRDYLLVRIAIDGVEEQLYRGAVEVQDFLLNKKGDLAFVKLGVEENQVLYEVEGSHHREIARFDFFDDAALLYWNEAQRKLLLRARFHRDLIGLWELTLPQKTLRLLHEDPDQTTDMELAYLDPQTHKPLMVKYKPQRKTRSIALDPSIKPHLDTIEKQLPGRNLYYSPRMESGFWLIRETGSTLPQTRYHLYQVATGSLIPILTDQYNKANEPSWNGLPPKIPFSFLAGDGFEIHGFVTLPPGQALESCPVVLNPHGGPFVRSRPTFSKTTHLLANRGYIVIQPNFRGSRGYGLKYIKESNRDFGDGVVQRDIIDSLYYLLSLGIGDPDRLAIFGHSFGGFSTLAALAFTPRLFKVGIAGAAPPDLANCVLFWPEDEDLGNGILRNFALKDNMVDVTDERDMARLRKKSPEAHADQIQRPLLMIAGKKDTQVSILDIRNFALNLEQRGTPISLFAAEDQGHNFNEPLPVQAYYYLIEKMLADHIGGRMEPIQNPKLIRYLRKHTKIDQHGFRPN